MKKLFISMLAVAALASCSQEDVIVADKGELIGFNSFVENSTRAADPSLTTATFTEFKLWGTVDASNNTPVAIFADDTVSGIIGKNSVWSCTTKTQYWINGAVYNFAGVKNGAVATLENGLPKTITYTADGSTDLVYARSKQYTGKPTQNDLVALEFKHLLSKVKFTLENTTSNATNAGVYTYTLTDVQIEDAITNGTYTVADIKNTVNGDVTYTVAGSWAPTTAEAKDNMEFEDIEGVTNGTSMDSANEKLIIPMTNATVKYNVNIYYGGEIITTIPGSATVAEFKPGYAYNLKLSTGLTNEIQFTVTEKPEWADGDGTTDTPLTL